jgi:PAS domain-containing protein
MQLTTSTLTKLPILACLRDRRGRILEVTQRLLDLERKRSADVVGKRLTEVWGARARDWLRLDRVAVRARKPVSQLEYGDGRWLQSTRLPQARGRVLWVAEDVSASVKLAAHRLMSTVAIRGQVPIDIAVPLLLGGTIDDVCAYAGVSIEAALLAVARAAGG